MAPSWDVPASLSPTQDVGASWLDGLDLDPSGALLGPAHPPQRVGPPLLVHDPHDGQAIGAVHMLGAHALFALPTADRRARWAPVLAQPAPWTTGWDGYSIAFAGPLWPEETDISVQDGEGADVPLAIFQRRHGDGPLKAAAHGRMIALERDAARVFSQHASWPKVRADLSTAPSYGKDPMVWAPWTPGDPLASIDPRLVAGLERVARLTKAVLDEDEQGTTALFLAGHWPLQDGTLSPIVLGRVGGAAFLSTRHKTDPRRQAFFRDALDALGKTGLLDPLARRPWLHTPNVQAGRVLIPATAGSAHQTLADMQWATAHGWNPRSHL